VLSNSGERILSDKVAGGKQRYRSFLPIRRDLGDHLKAAIYYHFKTGHREAA